MHGLLFQVAALGIATYALWQIVDTYVYTSMYTSSREDILVVPGLGPPHTTPTTEEDELLGKRGYRSWRQRERQIKLQPSRGGNTMGAAETWPADLIAESSECGTPFNCKVTYANALTPELSSVASTTGTSGTELVIKGSGLKSTTRSPVTADNTCWVADQKVIVGGEVCILTTTGEPDGELKCNLGECELRQCNPECVAQERDGLKHRTAPPFKLTFGPGAGGGFIDIRKMLCGDKTMSLLELWGAEYQENYALVIRPESVELFDTLCKRDKAPCSVVGHITGDGIVRVWDAEDGTAPVDLPLEKVPQKVFKSDRKQSISRPLQFPADVTVMSALDRVLRLTSVGSKRFLTNKVDRSVTGLIAQQQRIGPLQLTLSDVAVIAQSHLGTTGGATAIGEQPIKGFLDSAAINICPAGNEHIDVELMLVTGETCTMLSTHGLRTLNETVGAMDCTLEQSCVVMKFGPSALKEGAIHIKLNGNAGQSVGALLVARDPTVIAMGNVSTKTPHTVDTLPVTLWIRATLRGWAMSVVPAKPRWAGEGCSGRIPSITDGSGQHTCPPSSCPASLYKEKAVVSVWWGIVWTALCIIAIGLSSWHEPHSSGVVGQYLAMRERQAAEYKRQVAAKDDEHQARLKAKDDEIRRLRDENARMAEQLKELRLAAATNSLSSVLAKRLTTTNEAAPDLHLPVSGCNAEYRCGHPTNENVDNAATGYVSRRVKAIESGVSPSAAVFPPPCVLSSSSLYIKPSSAKPGSALNNKGIQAYVASVTASSEVQTAQPMQATAGVQAYVASVTAHSEVQTAQPMQAAAGVQASPQTATAATQTEGSIVTNSMRDHIATRAYYMYLANPAHSQETKWALAALAVLDALYGFLYL
ncbi:unnamed protein product [Vitrella brassicaformis CCMP3155]|uniref:IPT/TIG domain-containing protein n=1 Tax=Vitrella brassicaformis (strain CCMP3155) TaxID=1169540 RepID=A0A0G4FHR9_VITBC|nr:unnamed protein product [Vitrella brassicaformis CCMP3155]|eukprot:CEM12855.1 unnamed protein product [Vitrella brassicaformis CCMP3155]